MQTDRTRASRKLRQVRLCAIIGLTIALLPALLGTSTYYLDVATMALIYSLLVLSWDLFCGTTGELSFGHTFFVGAAAFSTAILQSQLGLSPLLAAAGGALAGALAGALIGVLTLRHRGAVFTMVTMAVQLSFHRTLFLLGEIFGGEEGIFITQSLFADPQTGYIVVAFLAVAGLTLGLALRETSFGRQLRASGGDTRVALASGVPVPYVRFWGSTLSGLLAGIGGSLLAMHSRVASHEMAGDALAGLIFLLAMVGGFGTLFGPWLAAILYVTFIREAFVSLGSIEPLLTYGLMLILLWSFPCGLAGGLTRPLDSDNASYPGAGS